MDISNICVIGDDKRMDYVAEELYTLGIDVYRDENNINNKSLIVLSPPSTEKITRRIIPYLEFGQFLYAGAMSNRLIHHCNLMQIGYKDYFKDSELTKKNAILTARGMIKYAVSDKAKLLNSKCLVAGYGYCGKAMAKSLFDNEICAAVDVMVRRRELRLEIENKGYGFIDMNNCNNYDFKKYNYVFNTVPALIFNRDFISRFPENVMFFDLASNEGGIDFSYCSENGIYAKQFPGIPGKMFPVEAGKAIAQTIINDINLR